LLLCHTPSFSPFSSCLLFTHTPPTEIYPLSLHDALPISFRPGRADLHDVAALFQLLAGLRRHAALHDQHPWPRGAGPERDREVLGVPGRSVDRFLKIESPVDVTQEKLGRPLVLLVAAGPA